MRLTALFFAVCLLGGCASPGDPGHKYPVRPDSGSERKAGPAMFLYEQAEEDADINKVTVTPPETDAEAREAED
ncbi:hypothetical protein [Desulforhopalus singaporensis]|uniref:Lipoprotein-attachment site-containing protein n=1 Tax=Desulforhopalus singaporensis TaxID=91360 RepID=A0A1H0THA4_9BACT|nr:hypothetical protein [Desulforhopalus singaporensis]SDP53070.1 hypothetical protein SAMN05660330_03080 [Desulforhopalus singaporensis]